MSKLYRQNGQVEQDPLAQRTIDCHRTALQRARSLVGLKGHVTNVEAAVMPTAEVMAKYHQLWQVERSFRMSKTDLAARPMFHRTRDAIEAHLMIVFTASPSLAKSRRLPVRRSATWSSS